MSELVQKITRDFTDALDRRIIQANAIALREAAEAFAVGEGLEAFAVANVTDDESAVRTISKWLNERADEIERRADK